MAANQKIPALKITLTHPGSQREINIDKSIYTPFKAAILQSLKSSKGKSFTELTEAVMKIILKKIPGFNKSIPWYTISILRDLETKGIVEPFIEKGKKMNRLKK